MTAFIAITVILAIVAAAVIAVTAWLERGQRELDALIAAALAEQAGDWGEPTRTEVEAETLAAVDLTRAEIDARYEAARLADRMDRIRTDIACNRFRRELDDFDGGAA